MDDKDAEKAARFAAMKRTAVTRLGEICNRQVRDDIHSVIAAKARAEKCGDPMEKAWVDYWAGMWQWADYEGIYHSGDAE